jgi:hypothetical protein
MILQNAFDVLPFQAAHGAVATLNVAVRDVVELVRQDVAGDGCQPFVIIRHPQHADVEAAGVRQQKIVHEVGHASRRILGDRPGVSLNAVPQ